MSQPITIHVVLQSHIDPVWLWRWPAGVDMVLNTCRAACELLDRHGDLIFTRGEAWAYRVVERSDPRLFDRITAHVTAGRWEVTGGWWVQPDCNLPSGFAFEKQISLGQDYLESRFGVAPKIAYNVDSFGHAASLPRYMAAAGQTSYVMMRPGPHEMALPSRVFRWRGEPGGPAVTTFRIAGAYMTRPPLTIDHLRACVTDLPDGVHDTMCFVGVGDHGGGVSEAMLAWLRNHADAVDGARLEFSSPSRFFAAIAPQVDALPIVEGELQPHAVGCYSVHRPIKLGVRRAEHALRLADLQHGGDPRPDPGQSDRLRRAWELTCFDHFHDTLGGTATPAAYADADAQLGEAQNAAEEALVYGLRRRLAALPDDDAHCVVLWNPSDHVHDDYLECEPWRELALDKPPFTLLDADGREVRYQRVADAAQAFYDLRILLRRTLPPGAMEVLRLIEDRLPEDEPQAGDVAATESTLTGPAPVSFDGSPTLFGDLPRPRLHVVDDLTDTWSHGVDRYGETPIAVDEPADLHVAEPGPLRAALLDEGTVAGDPYQIAWRTYAGEPFVEAVLWLHWRQRHRVLKWVVKLPSPATDRQDGMPGGWVARPLDGAERPLRDATRLTLADGRVLGVVCPDCFALDATPARLRLTLVRSPAMANHEPTPPDPRRRDFADQGEHRFVARFFLGTDVTPGLLDRHALTLQRPPRTADLTRGMTPT